MTGLSDDRLLGVLQYLAILLFVMAGLPLATGRRRLRRAAIIVFLVALGLALLRVGLWLSGYGA